MTDTGPQSSAVAPFLATLRNYRKVVTSVVALGAAPPILDIVFNVGPPWPERTGTAYFTTLVIWVILLTTYALWQNIAKSRMQSRIAVFGIASLVVLVVYTVVAVAFVYNAPDAKNQEAAGFILQDRIAKLFQTDETLSVQDIVEGANYDPVQVWKPWTVSVTRSVLLLSWLTFFGCLSTLTSVFVLLLEKQAVERARRTSTVAT